MFDKVIILVFDVLVIFCEELGCCYVVIVKYFGDVLFVCVKGCDYC